MNSLLTQGMTAIRLWAIPLFLLTTLVSPAQAEKNDDNALRVPPGFTALGEARDPATRLPLRIRHDVTGYELVYVAAGTFTMGAPEDDPDADECEMPERQVFVPGYWIGLTEVTNAQFRLFNSKHRSGDFHGYNLDGDSQPLVKVSWEEATAFCLWSGMRLPTEAEWEKAARGTDRRRYAWGNEMPPHRRVANIGDSTAFRAFDWLPAVMEYNDGYIVSAPVGSFPDGASPCGALDMTGNVSEWCQDGWDQRMWDYITAVLNVDEEAGRRHRIYRDGSFFGGPKSLLATSRGSYPLDNREDDIGFRAAVSPAAGEQRTGK